AGSRGGGDLRALSDEALGPARRSRRALGRATPQAPPAADLTVRATNAPRTSVGPAEWSAATQARYVAPVVSTSSTSNTRPRPPRVPPNAPPAFTALPARVRRFWLVATGERASAAKCGRLMARDTTDASTAAWSKPRSASLSPDAGTCATTSGW